MPVDVFHPIGSVGNQLNSTLSSPSHSDVMRVSVDFQKADIHDVIRFFSKTTGLNFVISDGVSGTVTARLIDVPWHDALTAILASQGLAAQYMGKVVLVK